MYMRKLWIVMAAMLVFSVFAAHAETVYNEDGTVCAECNTLSEEDGTRYGSLIVEEWKFQDGSLGYNTYFRFTDAEGSCITILMYGGPDKVEAYKKASYFKQMENDCGETSTIAYFKGMTDYDDIQCDKHSDGSVYVYYYFCISSQNTK